jgi:4-amino-4-deoxy-L-arabinose transferase-like glycosyltransferase
LKRYLPIIFLVALCLIAYFLSLGAVLRGENWQGYAGSFGNVMPPTVNGLPYGDNSLFRPLMYLIDWFEYKAFAMNPIGWRIIALLLHIGVVLSLYRVLKSIKDSKIAILIAGLFAVTPLIINQVLYTIIAPYMLFGILALNALYYLRAKRYLLTFILLGIATFIYEQGFIFVGLIGAYLFLTSKNKKWSLLFVGFFVCYVCFFIWRSFHTPLLLEGSPISESFGKILTSVPNAVVVISAWIFGSVFHYQKIVLTPNIQYSSVGFSDRLDVINIILLLITILVVVYCLYKMMKEYHGSVSNEYNYFMILIAIMGISYVAAITVVRVKLGLSYLLDTNQAAYTFGTLMCILVYMALIKFSFDKKWLLIPLCVLIAVGTFTVIDTNYQLSQKDKPVLTMIKDVNEFVNEHKQEPSFKFALYMRQDIQDYWDTSLYTDFYKNSPVWVLWGKYYTYNNPTYRLYFDGKSLMLEP